MKTEWDFYLFINLFATLTTAALSLDRFHQRRYNKEVFPADITGRLSFGVAGEIWHFFAGKVDDIK